MVYLRLGLTIELVEFDNRDKKNLKRFVDFANDLYADDPNYVRPLRMDLIGNRLLGMHGLLVWDHPFHEHAEVCYLLAEKGNEVVGRVAVFVNQSHIDFHKTKTGGFGFFEVVEDFEVAQSLLDRAVDWLKDKGMTELLGPMNFSGNETWGLLIDGFETYPYMETPYNKKYYSEFLERYGLKKAKDLIAQVMDVKKTSETEKRHERLSRIVEKLKLSRDIVTRPIDLGKGFSADIELMRQIYNDAWSGNWGFVPMGKEEFHHTAENIKLVADQGLIHFVYVKGEAAGFIGSIPDVNEMIGNKGSDYLRVLRVFKKRRKVKRVRLLLFGIIKKYKKIGLDAVLYHVSFNHAHEKGTYEECEISWLLEDNVLVIRAGESMGGRHYKTWRLYSRAL